MFLNGSPHAVHDLWDVGAHHMNLRFSCPRCGHWKVFHAAGLWKLFTDRYWSGYLSEVPQRFYCGVCWEVGLGKNRPKLEIVKDDAGDALPLPSEREWRHEAKRRR